MAALEHGYNEDISWGTLQEVASKQDVEAWKDRHLQVQPCSSIPNTRTPSAHR